MEGFKKFILRGNVVDLAVGIVIGAGFSAMVTSLVKDILTPLLAALIHVPDFSNISWSLNGSRLLVGDFINALVAFVLLAGAVYFFVVLPMNKLIERMKNRKAPADPTSKKCFECLNEIPIAATRCGFCSQPQRT